MTMPFGTRVDAALDKRGSLCVGIDPHRGRMEAWGLSCDVDGLRRFAAACAEAFADTATVVHSHTWLLSAGFAAQCSSHAQGEMA